MGARAARAGRPRRGPRAARGGLADDGSEEAGAIVRPRAWGRGVTEASAGPRGRPAVDQSAVRRAEMSPSTAARPNATAEATATHNRAWRRPEVTVSKKALAASCVTVTGTESR